MASRDDAIALVGEFEGRTKSGVWSGVTKADVVAGLRDRLNNANHVSSRKLNLCGPAAFVRNLVMDDPVNYVKIVVGLFEDGRAYVGSKTIKPSKDLLKYTPPAKVAADTTHNLGEAFNRADWIILASLRDSDNSFFDFQSVDDSVAGITMPHTMVSWFKEMGYTDIKNETNLLAHKDLANAKEASRLFSNSYKICLFINADMLDTNKQTSWSLTPDHWVVLVSRMTFTGTGLDADPAACVEFQVFTWGKVQSVPQVATKSLSIRDFLSNYYGYVACKH